MKAYISSTFKKDLTARRNLAHSPIYICFVIKVFDAQTSRSAIVNNIWAGHAFGTCETSKSSTWQSKNVVKEFQYGRQPVGIFQLIEPRVWVKVDHERRFVAFVMTIKIGHHILVSIILICWSALISDKYISKKRNSRLKYSFNKELK